MAATQHFRSAFRGFNREDVVHYIEYMSNQYNSKIEQLNTQLQNALSRQDTTDLQAQLDAALEKCAQLEVQLAKQTAVAVATDSELEAYRRAERTERLARERAAQIYAQADSILTNTIQKAESATANIDTLAQQVIATRDAFRDAINALRDIRPEDL